MSIAYLAQGLRKNTLVAGKTTAMRLVTAPWPAVVSAGSAAGSVWQLIPGNRLLDVGTYPSGASNRDGRLEVFVLGGDRALYHTWVSAQG